MLTTRVVAVTGALAVTACATGSRPADIGAAAPPTEASTATAAAKRDYRFQEGLGVAGAVVGSILSLFSVGIVVR